jgi:hypothetical protein
MKSARYEIQGSETTVPCQRQTAPALTSLDVRQTLLGAQDITRSLLSGRPQAEVARRSKSPLEYGIGAMIYQLMEKRILSCDESTYTSLLSGIPPSQNEKGSQMPGNRRTVIHYLRKNKFIPENISVRTIKPAGTTPTVAHVLKVTEAVTEVSIADILSRDRSRDIVEARFFAMWSLRSVSGTSFSVIGDRIGGKDHTTVINAVNQINLKRNQGKRDQTDQIVDDSDLIGIQSNLDLLVRTPNLRAV